VIELSLAHKVGTAVEQAYRRTNLPEQRRKLMEAWSHYSCSPPVAKPDETVVPMRARGVRHDDYDLEARACPLRLG
jgi:hypothetical protein